MSTVPPHHLRQHRMKFGPGEEKLAKAFELIDALLLRAFRFDAMLAIDQTVITALCAEHPSIRDEYRDKSAQMLAEVTAHSLMFGDHKVGEAVRDACAARHRFWSQVLASAADDDA